MKNINSFPIFRTLRTRNWARILSFLLIFAVLNLITGCFYYKVNTYIKPKEKEMAQKQFKYKFLMIHLNEHVWHITDIKIENNILTGTITSYTGHQKYATTNPYTANRYRLNSEDEVLNEIHIYTSSVDDEVNNKLSIHLDNVSKIEVYDPAVGATIASWIFGTVGVVAIAALVIFIIIALTKSSCPFIYIWDGNNYQFTGEIYSGSISPNLERNDYLPLRGLNDENGEYKLKISNEIKEIQHTNLTELLVIDHPEGSKVLIDKKGVLQTATDLKTPLSAQNFKGKDVLNRIVKEDSLSYSGDEVYKETDGIIMNFKLPKDIKTGKLFIRAKNTFWLENVIGSFYDLFGTSYKKWAEKQKKEPGDKQRQWALDQNIPLSVYVQKNNKWEFVEYYNLSGPMAFKEDVLPIDITGINSDTLKIKLESGSYFWDIDYVGMDFTKNIEITTTVVPLKNGLTNTNDNITNMLIGDDSKYYVQPNIGDNAILTFTAPIKTSSKRSIFLHSKGYYEILRNPTGTANRQYLEEFRKPGRFTKYSFDLLQSYSLNTKN